MVLKIIGLIFVISLAFGIHNPTQIKDIPFDVNEIINQVSTANPQFLSSVLPTGEFLVDTSTTSRNQYNPAIAFDGTNYLIVWEDDRTDSFRDIYGARVSQTGTVLDPNGIPISTVARSQAVPSIAFDGTNYLVVWSDGRGGLSFDIYGTRISKSGVVLDPYGIAISTAAGLQSSPSVAFDGTNYLVVWSDERNFYEDIYGARISQTGTILDPNGFAISTTEEDQFNPVVAFDGTNYLVVWEDFLSSDIYSTRVSQAGTVLDPSGIVITTAANYQVFPAIAFDETNYLVVWTDEHSGSSDINCARVNQAGIVIDSFIVSTQPGNKFSPALSHGSGNQVLITYQRWTGEYQGRIYNAMRIWGTLYPFLGMEEENSRVKIQSAKLLEVYPNPARSVIRVRGPLTVKDIKIFDVSGKLVKVADRFTSANEYKQEVIISLKGKNPGIYFLRLGKETKKFLVMK